MNFYNEHDPKAAAWLRELIARGHIAPGVVDERSIEDITPSELAQYAQCHFFAGIGGWSLALRLSGWPDDKPVWTGSCPCQPFSTAGKGKGVADERHLWPAFKWLIDKRQPPVVFGEQVASKDGREWLAGVRADLEDMGFAVGAADLCAASVGAPHIRQRLFWVAHNGGWRREVAMLNGAGGTQARGQRETGIFGGGSMPFGMADMQSSERDGDRSVTSGQQSGPTNNSRMGDPGCQRDESRRRSRDVGRASNQEQREAQQRERSRNADSHPSPDDSGLVQSDCDRCLTRDPAAAPAGHGYSTDSAGFWSDSRVITTRDGKNRRIPTESALFPLVDGLPYKLAPRGSCIPALLKGSGNAIVPQVASEFIQACEEACNDLNP